MDSRISFWSISILLFATCIRQGYTRRKQAIEVDGTVEAGSNITNILQRIILSDGKIVIEQKKPDNSGNYDVWQKTVQDTLLKYLFGTKNEQQFPTQNVKNTGRSSLWSAAEALISDLAVALATNPDGQAIVQPNLDNEKYSLLQDMRSGRIRGPVHVYGRHAKSGESSDDD